MPTLSEHFEEDSRDVSETRSVLGIGGRFTQLETSDPHSLREWWYTILGNHGRYPCYAIFLLLPSDEEAVSFLKSGGAELRIISGTNCLIIVLGNDYFYTIGLEDQHQLADDYLVRASALHIESGESTQVANLFGIEFTEFPCIVFFTDIRSSDFALLSMRGLKRSEISKELREVFSIIHREGKKDPDNILDALRRYITYQKLHVKALKAEKASASLLGKTIEAVIEAWVNKAIN